MTLNNPVETAQDYLQAIYTALKAKYCCGQLEKGENGTFHLQFFLNFKDAVRPAHIKKFDSKLHVEIVKINNGAHTYCMKEDTRIEGPWEFGEKPVQRNNKTDWEEVKQNAMTGKIDKIPADIYVKHYRNIKQIEKDHMILGPDAEGVRGIWLWGDTGLGKSRYARSELCRDTTPFIKWCNKWWDGYQSQTHVLMEDIDPSHKCLGHHLKIWTDRYATTGEPKGGSLPLKHTHFIVTSQYSIEQIWEGDIQTIAALRRRFRVTHFTEPYGPGGGDKSAFDV